MKVFGSLKLNRTLNKQRLRILFCVFIVCSLSYHFLPKLLFKLPPNIDDGWHDEDFHSNFHRIKGKDDNSKEEIVILMWTALWRQYEKVMILKSENCSNIETGSFYQPGASAFNIPCRISYDRRYLNISDALVFHSFDLMWEEVPRSYHRKPYQLWVYLQQESPIYTKLNLQAYPNIFNWTMTYRRDSDVYHPYAHLVPVSPATNVSTIDSQKQNSELLKKKKGLVAWVVSSCDSHAKREYFVQELQKYIPVNIFGLCGADCSENCYYDVMFSHKFYLSFENSLCTDYITEKFWNALRYDIIPVVYGGTQAQDYLSIVPKDSYIDARSFNSPQDLANYLIYLDKNEEEYLKYFEWKKKYHVESSRLGWCNLCQRVFEHLQRVPPPEKKWFKDLWKWWNYMSYDTSLEENEQPGHVAPSQMAVISQSYYYKLGPPACIAPPKKFIDGSTTKPDYEPGLLNGRIFGKLMGWFSKR